jgi:hypothetical protein
MMAVKSWYLALLIKDLINHLKGAQFFMKLNVCWGLNNIQIWEGDEWLY